MKWLYNLYLRGEVVSWLVLIKLSEFEPWSGTMCCFLGKTHCSRIASLNPGVQMGTNEINAGGNPALD